MFRVIALIVLTLSAGFPTLLAQDGKELLRSVYLIGNAANVPCDAPVMVGLRNLTAVETAPFIVLYSGDIIDDDGLEGENCADEEEKLRGLIEIGKNNPLGTVLFVPGERDWDDAGKSGLKKVKRLEHFLEKELGTKKVLLPTKGCPGPSVLDVGDDLRIIAVNSQWFLHHHKRPEESDADCDVYNFGEFWDEIDDYIEQVPDRNVIIAAHHPAFSYGQYAGHKSLKRHLFPLTDLNEKFYLPLPVLGSFYASYRQHVGTVRDLTTSEMEAYIQRLKRIFQEYRNVVYVSAHELDLQALYVDRNFHINSGAMEKTRAAGKGPETLFKSADRGFIKLEYFTDGSVGMKAFHLSDNKVVLAHKRLLMASGCGPVPSGIPVNDRYVPCLDQSSCDEIVHVEAPDHVTVAPNTDYDVGKLRRWVFGEHYRTTWAAQVTVPVLNLDTAYGGLTPFARGGGGQTHVLKFVADDGQWYYFRSVDKYPDLSLRNDPRLMKGWYGALMKDLTSGQYPYGSLVTDKLMDAAGIYHVKPRLFVMPDHPKLGVHGERFAGMLGTLELRPRGKNKGVDGFQDADKVVKTVRMFQHILDDHDNSTDAESYAKARLFDLLISDWDRQPDNWNFIGYGDKKAMTFYALPKDRDRAFSKWEGVYWIIDREFGSPKISNFGYRYGDFKSLTFKARQIDRMLLSEMTWEQWQKLAKNMQADLSDEVIAEATGQIPEEARRYSGDEIAGKLEVRRDQLQKATNKYYRRLARYVDIIGSNKREIFELERLPDGDVKVEVFKKKKSGEKSNLLYSRLIRNGETKEIRLYGLAKEDEFFLRGSANKSILVRIISGDDADLIVDSSFVSGWRKHTKVYDKSGKDTLLSDGESKVVYTKEEIEFTYEMYEPNSYMPLPSLIYNKDDGFGLGFGLSLTKQGFRKPGYSKKYFFKAAATTKENYWLQGSADFRHVVRMWDLQMSSKISNSERSYRHFYGTGNETKKDDELKKLDYYENLTNTQQFRAGLKREFWRKSHFAASTVFERFHVRSETEPSIYDRLPDLQGLGENSYAGSLLELNLDFTDAAFLRTRGVQLGLIHRYYFNLSQAGNHFGRINADMRIYETFGYTLPVTIGLRGGYIESYGDVPFYYLARVGQKDNLRGYLRNRFSGEKAMYFNADLRFDLGVIETIMVPVGVGLTCFTDTGRVWTNGEDSNKWHRGYGGGFYLSPVNENYNLTFTVATSEEEQMLFEFTLGYNL